MKKLYIAHCTEFELGWGSRPDGFILTEDFAIINNEIKEQYQKGSREIFWRYDEPEEIFCEDSNYEIIKMRFNKNGVANFSNHEKLKFSLYKKIIKK